MLTWVENVPILGVKVENQKVRGHGSTSSITWFRIISVDN